MVNQNWFIHVSDTHKRLYVSNPNLRKSGALSPCDMTPDDVDYEMSTEKDRKVLEILGMNQKSFEHFIKHYGDTYEYLSFFKCQLISDFSPLSNLSNIQKVRIYWNIRADNLWDMSGNTALRWLEISDAKKITYKMQLLNTARTLQNLSVNGDIFNRYPMQSLNFLKGAESLRSITLNEIKLQDHSIDILSFLPMLEEFNFNAGMLTTEEIAYICARYPMLKGRSLCAYNKVDALLTDVRVCGYRKPGLYLPEQQNILEKYKTAFDELVEKYKNEIEKGHV